MFPVVCPIFWTLFLAATLLGQCTNRRKSSKVPLGSSSTVSTEVSAETAKTKRKADKEKEEDTFDRVQPKVHETKRKKEIGEKKVENKGDYKTWNKIIENSEFNKTLSEAEGKKEVKKEEKEKRKEEKEVDYKMDVTMKDEMDTMEQTAKNEVKLEHKKSVSLFSKEK